MHLTHLAWRRPHCSSSKGSNQVQVIALSVSSKSKTDNAFVLLVSASNHSWLSGSLVCRLNLPEKKIDLILNSFNSSDFISTAIFEVTLPADKNNTGFTLKVNACLDDEIVVESQKVDISALQEYVYSWNQSSQFGIVIWTSKRLKTI